MRSPAADASPTNLLILTPQLTRAAGGVWSYLAGLIGDGLPGNGLRVTVAGVAESSANDHREIRNAADVIAAPPTLVGSRYGYARTLSRRLRAAGRFDVIHANGLRTFAGLEALRLARRTRTPYLLTPHGMFHPQLRDARSLKKAVIDRLWDRRYIERAACLHATSELEHSIMRGAGIRQPIAIVPIGVEVQPVGGEATDDERVWFDSRTKIVDGRRLPRRALFLGILDRKKGLPRLFDAWHALGSAAEGWSLAVAGPADVVYRAQLEAQAKSLKLPVQFLGPVWNAAQRQFLYASADLFVLPTDWENFGIVVAEALAARVPVITTTGAPWCELQTTQSGWWVEPTVPALTAALREAFALSDAKRRAMGERGLQLVQSNYAWPTIGRQMAAVYRWLAGGGERPVCVTDA